MLSACDSKNGFYESDEQIKDNSVSSTLLITGHSGPGEVEPDETLPLDLLPPGTLPDVSELPKADLTNVGENIYVSLLPGEEYNAIGFHYIYEPDSGKERLLVIYIFDQIGSYNLMSIYETDFHGVEGLCKKLCDGFTAKVLLNVNISFQESMYATNFGSSFPESEKIYWDEPKSSDKSKQLYFGKIIEKVSDTVSYQSLDYNFDLCLYGNIDNTNSKAISIRMDVMNKIYERFDLTKYIIG